MKYVGSINETKDLVTKAYVDGKAAPVQSVNGDTGNVVLAASDIGYTQIDGFPTTPNNTPTDVQKAIDNLFTYANSGKNDVADSIGYPTPYSDTFASLASNIDTAKTELNSFLPDAEITDLIGNEKLHELTQKLSDVRVFNSKTKLRKALGSTETIVLNKAIEPEKLTVNVLRLNGDNLIVPSPSSFTAPFNNGDEEDFVGNPNITFENNKAEVKITTNTTSLTATSTSGVKSVTLNLSGLNDARITAITNTNVTYKTLPTRQVLIANGDIDISSVGDFSSIQFLVGASTSPEQTSAWNNNGTIDGVAVVVVFALSFDSGLTWYGEENDSGSFKQITNIYDTNEFYNKGSRTGLFSSISQAESAKLDTLRNGSDTLRFAYLINNPKIGYTANLDEMKIEGFLKGQLQPAGSSATVSFDSTTKTITTTFSATDTYQINWIDTI